MQNGDFSGKNLGNLLDIFGGCGRIAKGQKLLLFLVVDEIAYSLFSFLGSLLPFDIGFFPAHLINIKPCQYRGQIFFLNGLQFELMLGDNFGIFEMIINFFSPFSPGFLDCMLDLLV